MKTLYSTKIELLFSNNDDMALGAINYLQQDLPATSSASETSSIESSSSSSSSVNLSFAERYFPIIGVDDTEAGQAAINEGTLAGTVLNNAGKQAKVIADLIEHVLNGTPIPDYPVDEVVPSGNFYHVLGEIVRKK